MNKINAYHKSSQFGYSLIEILVAMALSGMLLTGVIKIFVSSNNLSRTSQDYTEVQESGRVGLQLMSRDIRNADYWGCYKLVQNNTFVVDGVSVFINLLDQEDPDYSEAMAPYYWIHDQNTSIDTPDLTVQELLSVSGVDNYRINNQIGGITVKEGSDSISLRSTIPPPNVQVLTDPDDPDHPFMTFAEGNRPSRFYINPGAPIDQGERVFVTDCTHALLFTNTAADTENSGILEMQAINLPNDGAVNNGYAGYVHEHTFKKDSSLLILQTKEYFIGESQSINPDDTQGYSLYVMIDGGVPEELVRNVVDLQIEYGWGKEISREFGKYINIALDNDSRTAFNFRVRNQPNPDVADNYLYTSVLERGVPELPRQWDRVISVTTTLKTESTSNISGRRNRDADIDTERKDRKKLQRSYTKTTNIRNRSI